MSFPRTHSTHVNSFKVCPGWGRYDTQDNDTQHNDTQYHDTQRNNKKTTIHTVDTVMLSAIYAECRKFAYNDESHYAECRYAECRGAGWGTNP